MSGGCSGEDLDGVPGLIEQYYALNSEIEEKGRSDVEGCVILECESGEEEVDENGNTETESCVEPVSCSEDQEDGIFVCMKRDCHSIIDIVHVAVVGGTTVNISIPSVFSTCEEPFIVSHGMWCRMVLHVSIYCV